MIDLEKFAHARQVINIGSVGFVDEGLILHAQRAQLRAVRLLER